MDRPLRYSALCLPCKQKRSRKRKQLKKQEELGEQEEQQEKEEQAEEEEQEQGVPWACYNHFYGCNFF